MTIYFVNESINLQNSGIEHAEFDRADLFRKHHVDFKILTSVYLNKLHSVLPHFNIRDTESINLFDYFQDALTYAGPVKHLNDVDFGLDVDLKQDDKNPKLYTARATVNPNLFLGRLVVQDNDSDNPQIEHIEYFDMVGNLYKTEYYDIRGFKSLVQYYDPSGQLEAENWIKPDGTIAIIKTYMRVRNKTIATWRIKNHQFQSLDNVRTYFYNCLNKQGKNMFILDRSNVSEWQLTHLDRPAYLAFILHNCHTASATDANEPLLNDNYEWDLYNLDRFNCVISATPKQTRDVKSRFGNTKAKFFTVPVGVVKDITLNDAHIPMSERKHHSMLVTARIAPEKGIDNMIKALRIAQKTIPDLTLDVYGYIDHSNNDATIKAINKAKNALNDPSTVTIHKHAEDVSELQKQYQLYLIYSRMEGFNLALMEAQSHGMPAITNDVNYGPNDLVVDGKNGYVVDYDNVEQYAKAIVKAFSDPDNLEQLSENAYKLSERFSEDSVWHAWQTVLTDFKNTTL